jgi:hypothetical protein
MGDQTQTIFQKQTARKLERMRDPDAEAIRLHAAEVYHERREVALAAYLTDPNSVDNAYAYLDTHPILNTPYGISFFPENLITIIYRYDPKTGEENKKRPEKNTRRAYLLQCGAIGLAIDAPDGFWADVLVVIERLAGVSTDHHDEALDSQADTFDEALILLARRVAERYGHDRSRVYQHIGKQRTKRFNTHF